VSCRTVKSGCVVPNVIDLAGLGQLAESPLDLGGVPVPTFYAPGGFHPSTAAQGILGNTILDAFATAYDPGLSRFELTDQQILDDAGIAHPPGHSFYNVRPYVLYSASCGGQGDNGAATAKLDPGLGVKPRYEISAPRSFAHADVRLSNGARLTISRYDCLPEK
jgi:hypothetical protein